MSLAVGRCFRVGEFKSDRWHATIEQALAQVPDTIQAFYIQHYEAGCGWEGGPGSWDHSQKPAVYVEDSFSRAELVEMFTGKQTGCVSAYYRVDDKTIFTVWSHGSSEAEEEAGWHQRCPF